MGSRLYGKVSRKEKERLSMKKNDLILIAAIIFLAGVGLLWNHMRGQEKGGYAVVYVEGEKTASYSLSEEGEYEITTKNGRNLLLIQDGKADVTEADCPDSLCVKQTAIYKNGETIVCLPHKVVVEIQNGEDSDLDAISK